MKRTALLLAVISIALVTCPSARTWYITADGTGDAPTIQAGVDSATAGDTVLVACGTYRDSLHWDPSGFPACVIMKSGLTLRSETGTPECAVIENGRAILCWYVDDVLIEGLTFYDGTAWPIPSCGGGMLCVDSDVEVISCTFQGNGANDGGGLFVAGGSVTCWNCRFLGNASINDIHSAGDGYGGGVYSSGNLVLADCFFKGNVAYYVFDPTWVGAAAYLEGSTTIDGSIFANNRGSSTLACGFGSTTLCNSTFCANSGTAVYQVYSTSSIQVEKTLVTRNGGSFSGDPGFAELYCCDVYGNAGGDFVGCLSGQEGVNGNFSVCPSMCFVHLDDFRLCNDSPCLPGQHPDGYACGIIGAEGLGCICGPTQTESTTWGAIKAIYR